MLNRETLMEGLSDCSDEELLALAGAAEEDRRAYDWVREKLKDSRLRHSLGVMCTAVYLAERYSPEDVDRARLSGLLHDCAKYVSDALGHGPKGAELAREEFGIRDEGILSAIRWHTTGRAGMTVLEKLLYVADYMEPFRREIPGLSEVREAAFTDLDQAVACCASHTLRYLEETGMPVDPSTRAVAEFYEQKEISMDSSYEQLKKLYTALSEKQAQDITALEISGISSLGDYLVILHGLNAPHMDSLADVVEETMGRMEVPCRSLEGRHGDRWILMDYGDIIVNIFSKDDRLWYNLEKLWRDAKPVELSE